MHEASALASAGSKAVAPQSDHLVSVSRLISCVALRYSEIPAQGSFELQIPAASVVVCFFGLINTICLLFELINRLLECFSSVSICP